MRACEIAGSDRSIWSAQLYSEVDHIPFRETAISKGTDILSLEPGVYSFEDSGATVSEWLAMNFPVKMGHAIITISGKRNSNGKGYMDIYVTSASTGCTLGYRNSFTWDHWLGWEQYASKDDLLSISSTGTGPTDWTALEVSQNQPIKIWNVTSASTSKGAPKGCYDYGTLIAIVGTTSNDRWRNTLIYIPDNNNNAGSKVYVRSGISTKWLAFSGTDIDCVS